MTNEWVNSKNTGTAPTWTTANVLNSTPPPPAGTDKFIPGKGYLVEYETHGARVFEGTLNNSDITVEDLRIAAGVHNGWHLLGNPFPCALTWGGWPSANINGTAKIWDESSASYADIDNLNGNSPIIPALNGFMVQVKDGYSLDNSITIPKSARVHNALPWYKSTGDPFLVLVAKDSSGQTAQKSVVRFLEQATPAYDPAFDSQFLPGYAPQFCSVAGGDRLSTNSLPESGGNVQIPFDFVKNEQSSFTIEAETISDVYGMVILKDLKTNTTQDLNANPVYSFTSAEGDDPHRFMINFSQVGIGEPGNPKPVSIYMAGSTPCIGSNSCAAITGDVFMYNMMGQLVTRQKLAGSIVVTIGLDGITGNYCPPVRLLTPSY